VEFLKKYYNPKNWEQWFQEGLEDFAYSLAGNTLPLWAMIISNFLNEGPSHSLLYDSLHQPFTYVILSGTYLTSSFYLLSKPKMENKVFKYSYAFFLFIIGLFVAKKSILDDLSAPFYLELTVVIMFSLCFITHTYFLFYSHFVRLNSSARKSREEQKEDLELEFEKLNDDE
jgi:hypothetical protein